MSELRIGTAGWSYDHWTGPFYPDDLADDQRLGFYQARFDTVEVDNSFYHLPARAAVEAWRRQVGAGFRFAVKASRYITHMKKLKDPVESTARFFAAIAPLGEHLGPVLFQLPPHWRADPARLAAFIDALPGGIRYAFEFRDERWWTDEVAGVLAERDCAFCLFDLAGRQSPPTVTTDLVYLRLHGPEAAYRGGYPDADLDHWAERIRDWRAEDRSVWCYFDNDADGHAPRDAERLVQRLAGR